MLIKDMFEKPIDRDIKSIIKAEEIDENSILNELNEYVVTNKIISHFSTFFENYAQSIDEPTDKMGVWISGFFGSGKSHFLKILSYILNTNLKVNGKSAADILIDSGKIREKSIINNINKSLSVSNDIILMNIAAKANKDDRIVDIFYKEFNKIRGYSDSLLFLANLENNLNKNNKYDEFKEKFKEINGNSWITVRDSYSDITDDIIETLVSISFMSKDEAIRWAKYPNLVLNLTIETFAKDVNDYCMQRGDNHHIVFLIDELGQYISDNVELMLDLQTIVEALGTYCKGKAWVIVTSQQAIDNTDFDNDFSKIQGRFLTRLALSSAHVDEVIQKRILEKNDEAKQTLELIYDKSEGGLRNLLSFNKTVDLKQFENYKDFVDFYPFIPYQFTLMQKSLSSIRKKSSSGRHMSEGERSMIRIFNDSLLKSVTYDDSFLVPFYYFYESIQNDIDQEFVSIIETAEKNSDNAFDINVLKTLFLIKFINEEYFYPSIDNITILMISSINEDVINLKNKISESLNRLISETLVHKKGEIYYFLSDKEQDINREIKEEFIDIPEILNEMHNLIFEELYYKKKKFNINKRYDFKFDRIIDNKQNRNNEIAIRILTPFFEEEDTQTTLDDSQLFSLINPPNDEIIIDLRKEINIFNEIKANLQIKSYLDKKGFDLTSKLKCEKYEEYTERFEKIKEDLEELIIKAQILINGNNIKVSGNTVENILDESLSKLVNEVYFKLKYLDFEPTNEDIKNAIKLNLDDDETRCKLALDDLKKYISDKSKVKLDEVYENYLNAPYGYIKNDIAWLIITLFAKKKISLFINDEELLLTENNAQKIVDYIKKYQSPIVSKLFLSNREEIPAKSIKIVKNIYDELFDKKLNSKNEENVMFLFKECINLEISKIKNYISCVEKNKFYPGLNILNKNMQLFDEVNSKSTLYTFYNYVVDNEDIFYDYYEDLEKVYGFFNSNQKEIFDDSCKYYNIFNENEMAIDNHKLTEISHNIYKIISNETPFTEINELRSLNNDFINIFNNIKEIELQVVFNKLENDKNNLLSQLKSDDSKLKEEIEFNYDNLKKRLASFDDIRRIQGGIMDSNVLKERFNKKISDNDIKNSIEISLNNIFNSGTEIMNEQELEDFLDEIRDNILDELNKKNIVKIIM